MFAVCVCIQNPFGGCSRSSKRHSLVDFFSIRRKKERRKNKIELYGKMENTSLGFVARGLS